MGSYAKLIRKTGDIEKIHAENRKRWSAALGESAGVAGAVARQLVPVKTGFLRDSIFVRQTGDLQFEVGAAASYAAFIEIGTVYSEAQPFIGPALVLARRHLRSLLAKR
jgi:HK97 gp10 family phage protein